MASIDFGTGPETGDKLPDALKKLQDRADGTETVTGSLSSISSKNSADIELNTTSININSANIAANTAAISANTIKSDDNKAAIQALGTRAGASSVGYSRSSTASTNTIAAAVAALGVTAGDYGAKFDNSTNDTAAIQAMVDAASSAGVPVIFPGATARIDGTIDLKGRFVDLRGIAGKTNLRAGSAMPVMVDCTETSEIASYSPFGISGVAFDGDNKVSNAAISVRFRRDYLLEEIFVRQAVRGFRIKDGNNGTLRRCRTSAVQIGLHSEGSNHATHHDGCGFINASQTAVLVQNNGTANDGNNGLVFTACVAQDGAEDCYDVSSGCSINLVGCYTGETTGGFDFVNRGGIITVDGGIVYFGYGDGNYVVRPLGGMTYINKAQVSSQSSRGTTYLSGLTSGETGSGKIKYTDCNSQFSTGGDTVINGNVLMDNSRQIYAPRLGKNYSVETNDVTATSTLVNNNGRKVTVQSVTGGNPILGLQGSLISPGTWKDGEPFYLVIAYTSTKPVVVKTAQSVLGETATLFGVMPAAPNVVTYVKVEALASSSAQSILEMNMPGVAVGDSFTLYQVGLTDSSLIKSGIGVLPNLFFP